jgi:PAS domain S-box-containing protein
LDADDEVKGTILVVDDTPASIGMLQSALEQENYEVLIATSGQKALDRVELILPDLILLDIMMPGIDGYETCLQLKSRRSTQDIPIIFLSALSETFDKVRAFSIGGVDYLTKPVEPEELLVRVKTHIRINQLEKELQTANKELERRVDERTAELTHTNSLLRESEEMFRGIFAGSPIGIILLDKDGKVIISNPAVVSLFGLAGVSDLEEVNLFQDPNYHQGVLNRIKTGESFESEGLYDFSLIQTRRLYHTKKTGSMYYRLTVSSLHSGEDKDISGYIFLIQDTTEKKMVERGLGRLKGQEKG